MSIVNRNLFNLLFALGIIGVLGLFVHELGHGLTAHLLRGKFNGLYIFPVIQIWPEAGTLFQGEWQGYIGSVDLSYAPSWDTSGWQVGLVQFMGSGSNLILAIMALLALWVFRPSGWLRNLLLAESLVFIDLLLYTFLPLIGLRHWVFVGGDIAEPLLGAEKIGIQAWLFMLLVALTSSLMLWSILSFIRRYPVENDK